MPRLGLKGFGLTSRAKVTAWGVSQKQDYGSYTQWNFDIPKRQLGTGKICSL